MGWSEEGAKERGDRVYALRELVLVPTGIWSICGFIPYMSGYENLKQLADIKKIAGKEQILNAIKTVGLDKVMFEKIRGKTILLVSHNQQDIEEICDRTYTIDGGRI